MVKVINMVLLMVVQNTYETVEPKGEQGLDGSVPLLDP